MKRAVTGPRRRWLGLVVGLPALALLGGSATTAAATKQGRIAFERGNGQIYVINADGSRLTRLRFRANVKPTCDGGNEDCSKTIAWWTPAWSPNGRRLAVIGTFANGFLGGDNRVYIRGPDGRARDVFDTEPGSGGVSWSPDGVWLAHDTGRDDPTLILIRVRTGKERPLGKSLGGQNPTWSPDGKSLAFDAAAGGIATVRRDGSGFKLLTRFGQDPDWSSDGTKIAFASGGIRTVDDDGHMVLLTPDGGDPNWSPDGGRIVFERSNSLWIMDSNGSHQHLLVRNGRAPDWSR
jgi:Tol biopolymer transport system component